MDYQTLQQRVENWVLDLPDSTESLIASWINDALREAEARHNFLYMQAAEDYITVEGQRELGGVPELMKEPRGLPYVVTEDNGVREFSWAPTADQMRLQYGNDPTMDGGAPEFLLYRSGNDGEVFDVYPLPDGKSKYSDGEYRITVPYWIYSALLSGNADTNWMTDNGHVYLIYKATATGLWFNRDEQRAQIFERRAEEQFQLLRRQDRRRRIPPNFHLGINKDADGPTVRPRGRRRAFGDRRP